MDDLSGNPHYNMNYYYYYLKKGIMSENATFYSWDLICYGTEEDIKKFSTYFKKYAYIKHDKDLEEGTKDKLKKEHWHIIGSFSQRKSISSLKNYLGNGQNVLGIKLYDKLDRWEYLTHKNNPDKFQYNEADIVTNDKSYFIKNEEDKALVDITMIDDINKKLPLREMIMKYGRDYMRNYNKYHEIARYLHIEEYEDSDRKKMEELENYINNENRMKDYQENNPLEVLEMKEITIDNEILKQLMINEKLGKK